MDKPIALSVLFIFIICVISAFIFSPYLWPTLDNIAALKPEEQAFLQIEASKLLLQAIGGVAIIFALYLIYKRILNLEQSLKLTQEAQASNRFARAIEQLGTYKLEIQLGGIFALERIAQDSFADHWTVMEVLTAYVRENAKLSSESKFKNPDSGPSLLNGHDNGKSKDKTPSDIQSIVTVIGRRSWIELERENMRVLNLRMTNLSYIDLRRAIFERTNLRGCNLEYSNFAEANLSGAFLGEANLRNSNLVKANLVGANLVGANLVNANLRGANLRGANLMRAKLDGAQLADAQLEGANFTEVDLQNGNLCGVSLKDTTLTNTKLNKVRYDYDTIFPDWINQELKEELKMSFVSS